MKQRWWLIIALLLSLGLNLGFLASRVLQQRSAAAGDVDGVPRAGSAEDPERLEGRLPRLVRRMADELGLEGEQRVAFVEIQRTFFAETLAARGRMAQLQNEIRREVTSENPDRQALDEKLSELSVAHTDLERAFVTNLLDSRELLDSDQERRFMHFLHRMRHVRADVERRFRERWRRQAPEWPPEPGQPPRRGLRRFRDRHPEPPPGEPPPGAEPSGGNSRKR